MAPRYRYQQSGFVACSKSLPTSTGKHGRSGPVPHITPNTARTYIYMHIDIHVCMYHAKHCASGMLVHLIGRRRVRGAMASRSGCSSDMYGESSVHRRSDGKQKSGSSAVGSVRRSPLAHWTSGCQGNESSGKRTQQEPGPPHWSAIARTKSRLAIMCGLMVSCSASTRRSSAARLTSRQHHRTPAHPAATPS
jgi:hypothetical protein